MRKRLLRAPGERCPYTSLPTHALPEPVAIYSAPDRAGLSDLRQLSAGRGSLHRDSAAALDVLWGRCRGAAARPHCAHPGPRQWGRHLGLVLDPRLRYAIGAGALGPLGAQLHAQLAPIDRRGQHRNLTPATPQRQARLALAYARTAAVTASMLSTDIECMHVSPGPGLTGSAAAMPTPIPPHRHLLLAACQPRSAPSCARTATTLTAAVEPSSRQGGSLHSSTQGASQHTGCICPLTFYQAFRPASTGA